jgi:benzoyl-CoA reductase/2-hydroxyglutaryl-CoA dehydratase subunit BcrC/BadD/HgdB
MFEKSLNDIVMNIEKGDSEGFQVWVSVSGSLINGQLISHKRLLREVTEMTLDFVSIQEQAVICIQNSIIEEKMDEMAHELTQIKKAYLMNVEIIHGDEVIATPFAAVNLDLVGAWGLGTIK